MSASKKALAVNRYKLSGSLKKKGINFWRFNFNGIEKGTGVEKKFFIELYMLNPYLNPTETVLGFKSRTNISSDELQNVLAGSISAKEIQTEKYVIPSYVAVRVGILGSSAKQFCQFFPIKDVSSNQKLFDFQVGKCLFNEDKLSGIISYTPSEIRNFPEYMSDSGSFMWDLRYDIRMDSFNGYNYKKDSWIPTGLKTVFAGSVSVDGREYNIVPKNSFGYIDRFWGESLPDSWFHISNSFLTSIISGKVLENSAFSLQGSYNNKLSLIAKIEGMELEFLANKSQKSYESNFDCSTISSEDEKLHWSASFNNKKYVVDIDVYCQASDLIVSNLELPEGNRNILKLLIGSTGTGEIRIYKRIRKNLELIEHAHIANALCQFGQKEIPEK